ncbi:MAG: ribosomal protein S18-alanine N-acetyltransferase [Methanobrevibacter sp.]|jgi:ribosomal-protein-alanine N-acetyltransferase|nr:ribosomal protein S18-alanine N-acetyltransferase [Methanobrevibacter sp.]
MKIREFNNNDLLKIYEIELDSFSTPYTLNTLQQLYDIGAGFLVAEEKGQVIAYIIFWLKTEEEGQIVSLAVDKNFRGENVGSALLQRAINVYKMFEINIIKLEVESKNKKAIEFYEKFGFKVDEVLFHYYEDESNGIRMKLDLRESQ